MRFYACLLLLYGCFAAAFGQLRPEEEKGLSDALFLSNLNLSDLGFARRSSAHAFGLDFVHRAVDKPLASTEALMSLHEKGLSMMPSELIRTARIDILGDDAEPRGALVLRGEQALPDSIPTEVKPVVRDLAQAVEQANAYVHFALRNLTPVEKRMLIDGMPGWAVESKKIRFGFQLIAPEQPARIREVLAKVDLPLIRRAAEALAQETERDLPGLETTAKTCTWVGQVKFNCGGIKVDVSGVGDDVHAGKDTQLVIDLGGSNRYEGRCGAGVLGAGLLVDCGHRNVFQQTDLGAGCGFLGIGLAYLMGEGNFASAGSLSFGAGLGGVGILYANKGSDRFSAKTLTEGFGEFGIGALIEKGGDNHFSAASWGQGAARTEGVGWVVAGAGGNLMELNGMDEGDPTAQKRSCGQAYSEGYEGLEGGVALASMGSGDETLVGRSDCQSASTYSGLSSLYQASGGHRFLAESDAQGYAKNESASYLFSLNGDGSFLLNGDRGQSYAADRSVSFFLDRTGSNTYSNGEGGPSVAVDKGLAIFLHGHGKNRYPETEGVLSESIDGLALTVDMDAGTKEADGIGTVRPGVRVALDRELTKHAVGAAFAQRSPASVGSKPLPSTLDLEKLYAEATALGASEDHLLDVRDRFVEFGVSGFEWLIQHKLGLNSDAGDTLVGLVAKSLGQPAQDELALKITDKSDAVALDALQICEQQYFKEAGVFVGGALTRPALVRDGAYAAGEFKCLDTTQALMALAGQPDEATVLNAVRSLAALADPIALSTGQALLSSNDLLVREAAIDLVAATPGGFDVAKTLAKDPDEKVAREGIQILGKIGSGPALELAGQALGDVRSGVRIQALLALNGRVPDKFKPKIQELKQDPSALVRAVVAGLVG